MADPVFARLAIIGCGLIGRKRRSDGERWSARTGQAVQSGLHIHFAIAAVAIAGVALARSGTDAARVHTGAISAAQSTATRAGH